MLQHYLRLFAVLVLSSCIATGCSSGKKTGKITKKKATGMTGDPVTMTVRGDEQFDLVEVASSDRQWTGVAVSRDGRIFVNYPRWSADTGPSVGELISSNVVAPYPPGEWNDWEAGAPVADRFVCVQSVYRGDENDLWVLDAGNPRFAGVVEGAPKLVRIGLQRNKVLKSWPFDAATALPNSYLNDVRIDARKQVAYITDSGAGAIVVLNLKSGEARRLLEGDPSTQSDASILRVDGQKWKMPDGTSPEVHVDGLALDDSGTYLYYHALTGKNLYRIATADLLNKALSPDSLGKKVELLAETGAVDGMLFGSDGWLYLTTIETNSLSRYGTDGTIEVVVRDAKLSWPDAISRGARGQLYLTTSQVHRWGEPKGPYRLFRLRDPAYLP